MLVRGIPIEDVTLDVIKQHFLSGRGGHSLMAFVPFDNGNNSHWDAHSKRISLLATLNYVASYLNPDDWVQSPFPINQRQWCIILYEVGFIASAGGMAYNGMPVFASREMCLKAIELMGDDLYTLFNIPKP